MTNFPLRQVGLGGLVTDQSPYDLDLQSWSGGRNLRFSGGTVGAYSVFKDASGGYEHPYPFNAMLVGGGLRITPGSEKPFTVSRGLKIRQFNLDGTATSLTPTE